MQKSRKQTIKQKQKNQGKKKIKHKENKAKKSIKEISSKCEKKRYMQPFKPREGILKLKRKIKNIR